MHETLDPLERLVIAYAPFTIRPLWVAVLALDGRLARAAKPGKEPVLAQIKLAWWRERFGEDAELWPAGEPLLELLKIWNAERAALGGLVDGWEAREIGNDGGVQLRAARVEAMMALARLAGSTDDPLAVRRAALDWFDGEAGGAAPRLSRAMRPLALLRGMAIRGERGSPLARLLAVMRIGLIGR